MLITSSAGVDAKRLTVRLGHEWTGCPVGGALRATPGASRMLGMGVWVADDGASIPIQRVGAGRPVLLVHGGFTDSSGLEEFAERLSSSRTVVRYDRRGRPTSAPYLGGHRLARDIMDLSGIVDDLSRELGDVVVVGHSAGCHVALGAAIWGAPVRALFSTNHRPFTSQASTRRRGRTWTVRPVPVTSTRW